MPRSSARRGPARAPRRSGSPAEYGIPHISTGDMFRAAIAARHASSDARSSRSSTAATLVPDELTIELIRERLAEADAATGFVLDGFPRNLAQAEALDAMLDEIGRGLDAMLFFELADDVARERVLRRAARGGPRRRHARGDRAPARDLPRARPSRSSSTTARPASSCRCTPSGTIDEVYAEIQAGARAGWSERRVIIRKIAAARSSGWRAPASSSPRRSRYVGEHDRAGRDDRPSSTGSPRSSSARAAASRPSRATRATRPRSASRRTTMVVHGIPGALRGRRRATSLTVDVGVTLDGFVADSALHVRGRRDLDAEAQRLLDVCRARSAPGSSRRGSATASATSRTPSRASPRRPASRSSAASSATASAAHYHEDPQIPNFGQPGRGPLLAEGMTFAIEPMITAGGPDVVPPRRRMVDLDRRRVARRALRAHRRDHRRRARGS